MDIESIGVNGAGVMGMDLSLDGCHVRMIDLPREGE